MREGGCGVLVNAEAGALLRGRLLRWVQAAPLGLRQVRREGIRGRRGRPYPAKKKSTVVHSRPLPIVDARIARFCALVNHPGREDGDG